MKAFISYSHKDEASLDRLHKHMSMLKREGLIDSWFDRDILAGGEIDRKIAEQLDVCKLFLPLISADFLASDYCYDREMRRALERHEAGDLLVVPIIIRPCDWPSSPLGKLKVIPKDGKSVSEWQNQDMAYLDVVTELRRLAGASGSLLQPSDSDRPNPQSPTTARYRVKKNFDQVDRADFRDRCFEEIKEYFAGAIVEADSIDGIRGRFRDLGPTSFSCMVLNRLMNHGEAHITVHSNTSSHTFGDISYSFTENAPPSTSNGWFTIDSDDYELFVRWQGMVYSGGERVTPKAAAERLWRDFVTRAGIDYE